MIQTVFHEFDIKYHHDLEDDYNEKWVPAIFKIAFDFKKPIRVDLRQDNNGENGYFVYQSYPLYGWEAFEYGDTISVEKFNELCEKTWNQFSAEPYARQIKVFSSCYAQSSFTISWQVFDKIAEFVRNNHRKYLDVEEFKSHIIDQLPF